MTAKHFESSESFQKTDLNSAFIQILK